MDPNNLPPGHPDRPNPYNLPDPSLNPLNAIDVHSLGSRISPLAWPEHADASQQKDLNDAWSDATALVSDFEKFSADVDMDRFLSPEGKLQRKQDWVRKILAPLQAKLDKLTHEEVPNLERSLEGHVAEYMGKQAAVPSDPNDIQVCSEIRAMLRALPEAQRMSKIIELAGQGDRWVIQAVLHGPAYLSGVNPKLLREYQVELTRRALPNRMGPWQGRKDALLMTRRALDGVIRYIGGQTKTLAELRAPKLEDAA